MRSLEIFESLHRIRYSTVDWTKDAVFNITILQGERKLLNKNFKHEDSTVLGRGALECNMAREVIEREVILTHAPQ